MAEFKPSEFSTDAPTHYFNGFNIAFGNADCELTIKLDNRVTFHLKTTYTVAKTLTEKMNSALTAFEGIVGQSMLTTESIFEAIQRKNSEKPAKPADSDQPTKVGEE